MARRRSHVITEQSVAQSIAAAKLDAEQATAARTVLTGGDLVILRGRAGTGKSTTLQAVRAASSAGRHRVIGLAPTNAVAQDLRDSGFTDATTVHSLLWYREHAPDHERAKLSAETVLVVDEAAMLSTDILDRLSAAAEESGAKLVLVGDDRQLASIDRGGLFGPIADRIGAAELTTVRRQEQSWARRASEAFAEGRFDDGLRDYQERGLIEWRESLEGAERALVDQWRVDTETGSGQRFAFAYTNEAVDRLNSAMQAVEISRGRVRDVRGFDTERGEVRLGVGDPIAFRATDKSAGIFAGSIGSIEAIDGSVLTVKMGRGRKLLKVNAEEFREFSLGYAGTIYRGQGKTLDQAYLLHTYHWRDSASYVAMTRSRSETRIYVGRDQAADLERLGEQMSRQQNRGASLRFATRNQLSNVRELREITKGSNRVERDRN
jgi:ATP-dependent exoDNAse (exonuclease V) alpha subunit